jgi:hypothetical protein
MRIIDILGARKAGDGGEDRDGNNGSNEYLHENLPTDRLAILQKSEEY